MSTERLLETYIVSLSQLKPLKLVERHVEYADRDQLIPWTKKHMYDTADNS